MAKSMALVLLAAWLAVTLPMIARGTTDEDKEIERIENSGCSRDELTALVSDLAANPTLSEPFFRYLQTCGVEDRFLQQVIKHYIPREAGPTPFASFIRREILDPAKKVDNIAETIMGMIDVVDIDLEDCNEANTNKIISVDRKKIYYIDRVFDRYLEHCAEGLIKKVGEFKEQKKEIWTAIINFATYFEGKIEGEYAQSGKASRDLFLNEIGQYEGRDYLEENCPVLWEAIKPNIEAISHNCFPAREYDEVKILIDYIAPCEHFRDVHSQDLIRDTFNYLNAPDLWTGLKSRRPSTTGCYYRYRKNTPK